MANEENLKLGEKYRFTSGEMAVENGRKGGYKKAEKLRKTKSLKEAAQLIMSLNVDDPAIKAALETLGVEPTYRNAMTLKMAAKAANGSEKAYEVVRDTAGEAPRLNIGVGLDAKTEDELRNLSDADLRKMVESAQDDT